MGGDRPLCQIIYHRAYHPRASHFPEANFAVYYTIRMANGDILEGTCTIISTGRTGYNDVD